MKIPLSNELEKRKVVINSAMRKYLLRKLGSINFEYEIISNSSIYSDYNFHSLKLEVAVSYVDIDIVVIIPRDYNYLFLIDSVRIGLAGTNCGECYFPRAIDIKFPGEAKELLMDVIENYPCNYPLLLVNPYMKSVINYLSNNTHFTLSSSSSPISTYRGTVFSLKEATDLIGLYEGNLSYEIIS